MKRAIGACFVLVALTVVHCLAAEPAAESKAVPKEKPSPKAAADVTQPVMPERKLTFDISEEEQPMQFSAADPELLEQRYMARFQLVGPRNLNVASFGFLASETIAPYSAARGRHRELLFLDPIQRLRGAARVVKSALGEMPQERLPSEDVVSLLTKKEYPYYYQSASPSDPEARDDKWTIEFMILAPTPERAKELVQGVLSFYDYGVFYPLQKEALAVKRACEKRLEEDRASLQKTRQEMATVEKQLEELKEYEDITPEALVSFTTQQRLISVDMQGVKARIDACNRILASGMEKPYRRIPVEHLEALKITAEIELVGLAARKQAIEEIVRKGGQRKELTEQLARASSQVSNLETEISQISRGITHYEAELEKCMPYPVKDGKVVIRRIKWISAGRRGSPPPPELAPPEPGAPSARDP